MERTNEFQKTFMPARKWTALVTGSRKTTQGKLYRDIYGSSSNGHNNDGFNSPLHIASRKRQIDDSSDIAHDAKHRRFIYVKPAETPLPRKKLFVSTKASEAKASTSVSVPRRNIDVKPKKTPLLRKKLFVSTKACEAKASTSVSVPRRNIDVKPEETPLPRKKLFVSTKANEANASTSVSVPRRIPLVTPATESTAIELLERQEEGVRRQLERVREKLGMLITNRRYDDDDSFFTIRDRRIQSNLYYDFDKKEWMEYKIEEELPKPTDERKPIVQKPRKSYLKRKCEDTLARKQAAADSLFSEPLLIIPCTSKKARIEMDARQQ